MSHKDASSAIGESAGRSEFNRLRAEVFPIYQAFAETVRIILENALLAAEKSPQPQSIQCRAKAIGRLRRRLVEDGKLNTQTQDLDGPDLAGVRLISTPTMALTASWRRH